jgi:hypothetical protein
VASKASSYSIIIYSILMRISNPIKLHSKTLANDVPLVPDAT